MGRIAYKTYHIYYRATRTKESRPVFSVQNPSDKALEEIKSRYPESLYDYEMTNKKIPPIVRTEDNMSRIKWTSRTAPQI